MLRLFRSLLTLMAGDKISPYQLLPIPLDGGLDYLTPPSYSPDGGVDGRAGSLIQSLNYEIVERAGYKKIDGYVPHSGVFSAHSEEVFIFSATTGASTNYNTLAAGDYLCAWDGADYVYEDASGTIPRPFGIAIAKAQTGGVNYVAYLPIDRSLEPTGSEGVKAAAGAAGNTTVFSTITGPFNALDGSSVLLQTSGMVSSFTPAAICQWLSSSGVRDGSYARQQSLGTPIVGAKYFRDSLLAIADCVVRPFDQGLTQLYPGDVIAYNNTGASYADATGYQAMVIDVRKDAGTWGVDASGYLLLRPYMRERDVLLMGNRSPLGDLFVPDVQQNLYRYNADATYTANVVRQKFVNSTTEVDAWMADIWQTKSVNQVLDDPTMAAFAAIVPGWDTPRTSTTTDIAGWLVPFSGGAASSGFLNKIKRNTATQTTTFTSANTSANIPTDVAVNLTDTTGKPTVVLTGLDFDGAFNWNTDVAGFRRWDGITAGAAAALSYTQLTDFDDTNYIKTNVSLFDVEGTGKKVTHSVGFFGFGGLSVIPANSIIEGITLKISLETTAGFATPANVHNVAIRACLVKTSNLEDTDLFGAARTETRVGAFREQGWVNSGGAAVTVPSAALATATQTLGSTSDLWGNTFIDREELIKPEFGVAVDLSYNIAVAHTDTFEVRIHKVQLEVQYSTGSVRYYFADATNTNIVYADLIDYQLSSGSFATRDAVGYLQVTRPTVVAGALRRNIRSGYTMYNKDPTGVGEVTMATITGDMTYNGFEASRELHDAGTRYEFINANFYQNPDYEGVYFVNGVGRARAFDGQYITTIHAFPLTETDGEANDKPRHLAAHHGRLALGYASGAVLYSALEDPENFDPIDGAFPLTTGDPVVGLLPLTGTTMGVFCKNSIQSHTGTSLDNMTTAIISPSSGCIEYTLQDMGNFPVYCDSHGVATVAQSEKYGDFVGARLSFRVTPWLLPRLRRGESHRAPSGGYQYFSNGSSQGAGISFVPGSAAGGIRCSTVSRKKNQYLLFFVDGTCLCMSLVGPERDPQFTLRRYNTQGSGSWSGEGEEDSSSNADYFVPLALTSDSTETGENRIFMSRDPYLIKLTSSNFGTMDTYVFELDRGWGMGGASFTNYITLGHFYLGNPFEYKTIRAVRLEILGRNLCSLRVFTKQEYSLPDLRTATVDPYVELDVPTEIIAPVGISADYTPQSRMLNGPMATGRSLNISFTEDVWSYATPPFYLQMILVQYEPGREDS
jgi:hypothetical protein